MWPVANLTIDIGRIDLKAYVLDVMILLLAAPGLLRRKEDLRLLLEYALVLLSHRKAGQIATIETIEAPARSNLTVGPTEISRHERWRFST
jgi:hypothetical protein